MKILVPVKQVSVLDDEFEMRDDGRGVDEDFFEKDLNEFDHFAVEEALLIKEAAGEGAEVVIVTVGDDDADDALRTALAKGAERGIRVWDDALADADSIAIAKVLAKVMPPREWRLPVCWAGRMRRWCRSSTTPLAPKRRRCTGSWRAVLRKS
jgi:electron transfer flavoprotein beta subunit